MVIGAIWLSFESGQIDCLRVPENSSGRRILLRCFTYEELAYLHEQPQFVEAVAAMVSLTDCEQVVIMGHRLLLDRDGIVKPG